MKKVILGIAAMVAGLSLSAQEKGDMYVSGILNLGLNSTTAFEKVHAADEKASGTQAVNMFNFGIAPKFGYFVADNLEVNIALRYGLGVYGVSGKSKYDGKVEKEDPVGANTNKFFVNPGVSYHIPVIAGKFYYVPSFGLGLGFANESTKVSEEGVSTKVTSDPRFAFGMFLDFLAFEYRLNDNMGLTMSVGGLGYTLDTVSKTETEPVTDTKIRTTTTNHGVDFGFDKVALGFRYYF